MSDCIEVRTCSGEYRDGNDNQALHKITVALAEVTASTHMLLEDHKELRDCLHHLYEHNSKIETLEESFKLNQTAIVNLQAQLKTLEHQYLIHQATYEARVNFLSASIRYGPMFMGILMTIISIIIAIKELAL